MLVNMMWVIVRLLCNLCLWSDIASLLRWLWWWLLMMIFY